MNGVFKAKYAVVAGLLLLAGLIGGGYVLRRAFFAPASGQASGGGPPAGAQERVLIPASDFLMGSPEGEGGPDERPRHKVYLDAYYIDKYEVTVAKYKSFAAATGHKMRAQVSWSTDLHPVVNVSWHDAAAYCQWAGGRLPTEAQWEKAARGGTAAKYHYGDAKSALSGYAWYVGSANSQGHPVGRKKPNQYGLYDMHGNAWEWVRDWYGEYYYKSSPEKNPKGPAAGVFRVLRGGAWNTHHYYALRAAHRTMYPPAEWNYFYGFRCAYGDES